MINSLDWNLLNIYKNRIDTEENTYTLLEVNYLILCFFITKSFKWEFIEIL